VALTWDEGVLDGAALEEDFLGAWDQLVNRFREARLDALSRKAGQSGWTAEDMQLYRELQQRPPRVAK
jgi:hypothetical protein